MKGKIVRKSGLAVIVMLALGQTVNASKQDQRNGRQEEAYKACVMYLHDNSKSPESFSAEAAYTFKLANFMSAYRAGKNQIIIFVNGRGMKSYGAVLRHSWTCWAECSPNKPCNVAGEAEE